MTDAEQLFLDWLGLFDSPISMSAVRSGQLHVGSARAEGLIEDWERLGWVKRHPAAIESAIYGLVDGFTLTTAGREQARLERHTRTVRAGVQTTRGKLSRRRARGSSHSAAG